LDCNGYHMIRKIHSTLPVMARGSHFQAMRTRLVNTSCPSVPLRTSRTVAQGIHPFTWMVESNTDQRRRAYDGDKDFGRIDVRLE
jgi:hypothetical protein